MSVRVCRKCGCTELTACFTVTAEIEPLGYGRHVLRNLSNTVACHWVEDDLCSACPKDEPAEAETKPVKVIDKFELHSVSIDKEPSPYGGRIEIIESHTVQPSQMLCNARLCGETHHLVPAPVVGGEMVCVYCLKSEKNIREEATL